VRRWWVALAVLCMAGCGQSERYAFVAAPNRADTLARDGALALGEGRPAVAADRCSRAAAAEPAALPARLTLAESYLADKRPAAAERELLRCVADFGDDPAPHRALAGLYAVTKRPRKAIAEYQRVLDRAPQDAEVVLALAQRHVQLGERAAVERVLRDLLRRAPAALQASTMLAAVLRADSRNAAAIAVMEQAAAATPKSPQAHSELGARYQTAGRVDEAEREYRRALKLNDRYVPAYNNLAYLYEHERREPEMAEQMARPAASADPTNGHCLDTLGWLLLRRGLTAEAIDPLERAHRRLPSNPSIAYHLAAAYAKSGAAEPAKALLTAALASKEAFPEREACGKLLRDLKAASHSEPRR